MSTTYFAPTYFAPTYFARGYFGPSAPANPDGSDVADPDETLFVLRSIVPNFAETVFVLS